jgi:hypothetical protein
MAFPTSPTNGQQATVNGVIYIYDSTLTAWTVTTNIGANISANNITVTSTISSATLQTTSIVNTTANGVGNIGSSGNSFNVVFARATSAQYADLAEMYAADAHYPAGTVVIFGGEQEVTVSNIPDDQRIAGVVSTNPSYLMNSMQQGDNVIPVALTGRVPCLVTGEVCKGDLMVAAGNGHACANNQAQTGSIIGKALENYSGESGVIEVVVGTR